MLVIHSKSECIPRFSPSFVPLGSSSERIGPILFTQLIAAMAGWLRENWRRLCGCERGKLQEEIMGQKQSPLDEESTAMEESEAHLS